MAPKKGNNVVSNYGPPVPEIYPEYLTDSNVLICPSDAQGGAFRWTSVDNGLRKAAKNQFWFHGRPSSIRARRL